MGWGTLGINEAYNVVPSIFSSIVKLSELGVHTLQDKDL